jgi:TRAP-type C4-dicarboxylate transport system permease small subunit
MGAARLLAIVLIVAGIIGLIYGGFSYSRGTHEAKMGSMEISIQEKRSVNVPLWAGVGALVVGGALLLVPHKKN